MAVFDATRTCMCGEVHMHAGKAARARAYPSIGWEYSIVYDPDPERWSGSADLRKYRVFRVCARPIN